MLQRQLVEQHFIEHQNRMEQTQRMVAEHQQRRLMANELEKRLTDQLMQHQQQRHLMQQQVCYINCVYIS